MKKKITRKQGKRITKKHSFWLHYHRMIELCYEGNPEMLTRLDNFDDVEDENGIPLDKAYVLANIPQKYFEFDYVKIVRKISTTEENEKAVGVLDKYVSVLDNVKAKGIGLYLCGPHGVAKTTLATIILRKAIAIHYKCFFLKSSEIIEFIRGGWKNDYRKAFFEYVINNVDFLVVDDIARVFEMNRNESSAERMYLDKIFTRRDDLNVPTILTANHIMEDNRRTFGEALFSNFRERLIEIYIRGEDFRTVIGDNLIDEL